MMVEIWKRCVLTSILCVVIFAPHFHGFKITENSLKSRDDSKSGMNCGFDDTHLNDSTARSMLTNAGITVHSSCGCTDRGNSCCTSLDYVRCQCIRDIIWLKEISNCYTRVTGGTEIGHANKTKSHYHGYKLDVSLGKCVDSYVTSYFPYIGRRTSDQAKLYKDRWGNIYALENNHWDILYP